MKCFKALNQEGFHIRPCQHTRTQLHYLESKSNIYYFNINIQVQYFTQKIHENSGCYSPSLIWSHAGSDFPRMDCEEFAVEF